MAKDPWRGLEELVDDLAAFDRGMLPAVAPDALEETAQEVVSQSRRDTPRRTGRSADSIEAGEVEVDGKAVRVDVGSDYFVMAIIEFGNSKRTGLRPIARAIEEQGPVMRTRLLRAMERHAERHNL